MRSGLGITVCIIVLPCRTVRGTCLGSGEGSVSKRQLREWVQRLQVLKACVQFKQAPVPSWLMMLAGWRPQ